MTIEADILARVRAAAEIATDELADRVLAEGVQGAPIETGRLRESMRVDTGPDDQDGYEATVSANTPYAARQHEELDYKHPNGGHAKYLEIPIKRALPDLEPHISKRVREALGG